MIIQPGMQLYTIDDEKNTWFWYVRVNSIKENGDFLCDTATFYKGQQADYFTNTRIDIENNLNEYNIVESDEELKQFIRMLFL